VRIPLVALTDTKVSTTPSSNRLAFTLVASVYRVRFPPPRFPIQHANFGGGSCPTAQLFKNSVRCGVHFRGVHSARGLRAIAALPRTCILIAACRAPFPRARAKNRVPLLITTHALFARKVQRKLSNGVADLPPADHLLIESNEPRRVRKLPARETPHTGDDAAPVRTSVRIIWPVAKRGRS
jgi:hypothetical protein